MSATEYTGYAVVIDDPNDPRGFWWVGAWHHKEVADDIAKKNGVAAHVVPISSVTQSASASILKAIDDEPELPGEMPDEMWEAIKGDRDAVQEAMRIAVRQTKSGIRDRVTHNPADSRSHK